MENVRDVSTDTWHAKVGLGKTGDFVAWGRPKDSGPPLTADCATLEPHDPVYFEFGRTPEVALWNLLNIGITE